LRQKINFFNIEELTSHGSKRAWICALPFILRVKGHLIFSHDNNICELLEFVKV